LRRGGVPHPLDRRLPRPLRTLLDLALQVLPISVAGVGIGLINDAGNLGGTVGAVVFGYDRGTTGSFNATLTVDGIALIGADPSKGARRSIRPGETD
jgi:hypothetical protein